jgi:hypothetical protein
MPTGQWWVFHIAGRATDKQRLLVASGGFRSRVSVTDAKNSQERKQRTEQESLYKPF